jgi:hypothetical protein
MTQNIYDDPEFFQGYSQMARSIGGLDAAPEWPALKALLPPMLGLKVVDLGCGYGWFCRWASEQGADSVLGLDVSQKMLEQARKTTSTSNIRYEHADIEHPIFMAPRNPGWIIDAQGRKSWPVDGYQMEGERVTNWLADGVIKQHRTIGTLLNTLIGAGFNIRHVNEWGPSDAEVAAQPALAEERERPMMMLVGVQR